MNFRQKTIKPCGKNCQNRIKTDKNRKIEQFQQKAKNINKNTL